MKFQTIVEGEIHAIEPVVRGEPLGLEQVQSGTDTSSLLKACIAVLSMANAYAHNPSPKNLDALAASAKAMKFEEERYLRDDL